SFCASRTPSSPDAAADTRKPSLPSSRPSMFRIISSSSTTRTDGDPALAGPGARARSPTASGVPTELVPSRKRQPDHEDGPAADRRLRELDLPTVLPHQIVTEREAEPRALLRRLGREK